MQITRTCNQYFAEIFKTMMCISETEIGLPRSTRTEAAVTAKLPVTRVEIILAIQIRTHTICKPELVLLVYLVAKEGPPPGPHHLV